MEIKDIVSFGLSKTRLAFGLLLFVAGLVFIALALRWHLTLAIAGHPLPQWVFYLIAIFLLILGIPFIIDSFKTPKCSNCKASLMYAEFYFQEKDEKEIVSAAKSFDIDSLKRLPAYNSKGKSVCVSVDYCENCCHGLLNCYKVETITKYIPMCKSIVVSAEHLKSFLSILVVGPRRDKLKISN